MTRLAFAGATLLLLLTVTVFQGVSADDAAKRADLTKHKEHIPSIQGPGVPIIVVTRIYELLDRAAGK